MGYQERAQLFQQIEQLRERPLVAYVTSIRPGLSGQMAGDAIRPVIDQLELIPKDKKKIDFLIISNGGDPITAMRIVSLLRERFDEVSVLLPYVAYSAATILSLGADEIVMHPYSNLGPVDPQLDVLHKNAEGQTEKIQFGSEDIVNFIEFIKKDVGISDQQHLIASIKPLIDQVGSLSIGNAKRGQRLSLSLSERMLSSHIDDPSKVSTIAKALNSSYYHHGYAVGRKEAKSIGLPITEPDINLEDLLWKVWLDYELEMKCGSEFNVIREILDDSNSGPIVKSISIINIPANLPETQKQTIYNQVVSNIAVTKQQSITINPLVASIESTSCSKAFYNEIVIHYWRDAAMNLKFNVTLAGTGWVDYK